MPKLVYTSSFNKPFKKFTKGNQTLKESIFKTLLLLEEDSFSANLRTHKLSGNLFGLLSCSCGYDCRIVFSIEKYKNSKESVVILIDVGTHDEIY